MNSYTFIISEDTGKRRQWTCQATTEDNAWEKVYARFPNAVYIELF